RPNVLIILVDDLNASLGCYGNSIVQTPNIDRLAGRGVKFERAYCQYPVCNPSRTSILSGLRRSRTGGRSNSTHPIPDRNGWRRVVQIMQEKLAKDRPFFLAAGFRRPHLPWVAPKKYFDLYREAKIEPPLVPAEHLKSLLPVAVNKSAEQEVSPQQAREFIAAYYACVSFMDAQVGVILRELER